MTGNLRSPRARRRHSRPMQDHDRLPPALRQWLCTAALPWSARSALRLWQRALRDTGCTDQARARMQAAEARTLAREAAQVWGPRYPGYCGTSTS